VVLLAELQVVLGLWRGLVEELTRLLPLKIEILILAPPGQRMVQPHMGVVEEAALLFLVLQVQVETEILQVQTQQVTEQVVEVGVEMLLEEVALMDTFN
jgi:hypothetical protein